MNNDKYTVIALFGKSGAGKDTLQKIITNKTCGTTNKIISCTTRPPREGEIDGVHYHFINEEEFEYNMSENKMLETSEFRSWYYGTPWSSLNWKLINIGVFNIKGIKKLLKNKELNVIPVYVYADDKKRLMRSLSREAKPDCTEICRRFFTDERDFENIDNEFSYIFFDNSDTNIHAFNEADIYKLLLEWITYPLDDIE